MRGPAVSTCGRTGNGGGGRLGAYWGRMGLGSPGSCPVVLSRGAVDNSHTLLGGSGFWNLTALNFGGGDNFNRLNPWKTPDNKENNFSCLTGDYPGSDNFPEGCNFVCSIQHPSYFLPPPSGLLSAANSARTKGGPPPHTANSVGTEGEAKPPGGQNEGNTQGANLASTRGGRPTHLGRPTAWGGG